MYSKRKVVLELNSNTNFVYSLSHSPLYLSLIHIYALEFWDLKCNVAGSRGKVSLIMATPIALALFAALVPGRLGQLLCLSIQQLVEDLLLSLIHIYRERFCQP